MGYGNGVWVCAARGEQRRGDVCGVWLCDISIYGVCIPCAWCVCDVCDTSTRDVSTCWVCMLSTYAVVYAVFFVALCVCYLLRCVCSVSRGQDGAGWGGGYFLSTPFSTCIIINLQSIFVAGREEGILCLLWSDL